MSDFLMNAPAARVNKIKGEILAHAIPVEVLGIAGEQKRMPANSGDTILFRRWLPFGAISTAGNPGNNWGVNATAHITSEGVTPTPDTLVPQDFTTTQAQYACLYALTDKVADMYEDDVVDAMKKQTGERMGLVRELARYGILKACTNQFYAGGTTRATVAGKVSLTFLRKITRSLKANHSKMITSILAPSANFGTRAVEAGYLVFLHTDCEADVRDLPKFTPTSEYGNRKVVHEMEIGSCENFRFVVSPELASFADAGAAVGATGLFSTTGTNIDVYPMIIAAEDAWSQVALRGVNSIDPTMIAPNSKDTSDPLGQRGYVGAKFYFTALITNNGWMAVGNVGVSNLT